MSSTSIVRACAVLFSTAVFAGCDDPGPTVVGSGKYETVIKPIPDCHAVELFGVGKLTIRKSPATALTIKAEDNLIQYVTYEVKDGVLRAGVGNGTFTWHRFPELILTVKDLDSIDLSGMTEVYAESVDAETLTVKANGQCSITIDGKATAQTYRVDGDCKVEATRLTGKTADIKASGVVGLHLSDLAEIRGKLDGAVTIDYAGKPAVVDVKTSGASKTSMRP